MRKRILVVDDEADFSEMLQFRLQHLNYEVFTAASGTEAMNRARSELPDAILLDLLLPDFDGLTVCQILRQQPATRNVPVLLITAITNAATQHAAWLAGASGFLGKPLNFEKLKWRLEVALVSPPGRLQEDELPGSA